MLFMYQKKLNFFLFVAILVFFVSPPVAAYLDPGFGSMVWQLLAAVVFGVAFTLKIYWMKIKNYLSGEKN
jgi:hypothetical protein